jgi:hypothetical protein
MGRDLPAVFNGVKSVQTAGRDSRGRFVAGAPAGPGRPRNPYARAQAALRVAVLDEVDERDLRAVVRTVLRLAKRGNVPATELLFKWIVGPPPEPTHPDCVDAHELQVRRSLPTLVDLMALADEQADRAPTADDEAEDDLDDAEEEAALPPVHPQVRELLSWAIQQLAEAQKPAALPLLPDPAQSWEVFAHQRLEWVPDAAAPLDYLLLAYVRWCMARGEPVLAEEKLLAWLKDHGAGVRTGALSAFTSVVGVRLRE